MIMDQGIEEKVTEEISNNIHKNKFEGLVSDLRKNEELMKNKEAAAALSDIELLLEYCDLFGTSQVVRFDPSLSRGQEYYTGIVYEAVLVGEGKMSNIFFLIVI